MRRLCILVISFFCFSCVSPRYDVELLRIENSIQSDPATSLKELSAMYKTQKTEHDESLFSLLYSIALDKNYIDLKNDSIIQPAVSYYSKHKDPSRTFLSLYYCGRVLENAEDYDQALLYFIKAEAAINSAVSGEYSTRLYSAKSRVYFKQLALDKALEEAQKSKKASINLPNKYFYIRSCLDAIIVLNNLNRSEEASAALDSLTLWINDYGGPFPSDYYMQSLYNVLYHSKEGTDSLLHYCALYENACKKEKRKPETLLIAAAMLRTNNIEKAKALFNSYHFVPSSNSSDSIRYYTTATNLYKDLRDFDNYVASVQESRRLIETKQLKIFRNDVRFLEERYNNSLEKERKKIKIILLSFLLGIMAITLAISIVYNYRKNRQLQRSYNEIRGEYDFIRESFKNCAEDHSEIRNQLNVRIQALHPYFQNVPSKKVPKNILQRLKHDNQEMLRNICLLYSLSFPAFVAKLVKYGLNSEEIGLCSLYASGFVSKELAKTIDSGSIYIINCDIRAKLGDSVGGRTLPAWLRDLFQESI